MSTLRLSATQVLALQSYLARKEALPPVLPPVAAAIFPFCSIIPVTHVTFAIITVIADITWAVITAVVIFTIIVTVTFAAGASITFSATATVAVSIAIPVTVTLAVALAVALKVTSAITIAVALEVTAVIVAVALEVPSSTFRSLPRNWQAWKPFKELSETEHLFISSAYLEGRFLF
ncbi:hypothetical protein EV368DRAFT_89989 [Lentinula lateritia]|nr:hypothetical protein EV368DRAFT_89989 [Lentinula lateritia]